MNDREKEVLDVLEQNPGWSGSAASVARLLNYNRGPCSWAPVGPPLKGEVCASVPSTTQKRVNRILKHLYWAGRIGTMRCSRKPSYTALASLAR